MSNDNYTRPRNQIPKLEALNSIETYAITISPNNTNQFSGHTDRFKHTIHQHSFTWLKDLCKTSEIKLYMEFSPEGRIHYHGTIKINDIFKFYQDLFPMLNDHFTCVIKPIKDQEWIQTYCQKQAHIIQPYCEENNIDYPLTNSYVGILQHQKIFAQVDYDISKYKKPRSKRKKF